MKIGSAITFLVLALVALGYFLADNINMREELVQIQQQNTQLIQENRVLRNERDVAISNLATSEQRVLEFTQKNLAQEEQIRKLNSENIGLKDQITSLQKKVETLQFFTSFQSSLPKSLSLALLLPVIPASMAVTYVLVRYNKNHHQQNNTKKNSQRNTLVQLTDDEIREIIKKRRNK